ncbi:transcriptional regulator [Vitreoscilla filiformis]|uniref:Transcriptional regulator n=1 Tax=Vitreoscilla filiformis TaxID=63 RepID=A0A221KA55_VITFI|nr:transcriptional regulator [Vitreoscilla filiformis]ASM76428.1 transcriptional regulator [Vitreoscilla filiformis]ASM76848.1 transcriptional regulator [Vitreoscilla filiformis]ASM77303.1 transcriptional regulator [Vitreoscilla filiformis]
MSKKAQFNFENDDNLPGGAYLIAAAELGVDVLYVLTGRRGTPSVAGPVLRDGEAELLEGYRALDARGRLSVKAFIAGVPSGGMSGQSNGGHVIQGSSNVVISHTAPTPIRRRAKVSEK